MRFVDHLSHLIFLLLLSTLALNASASTKQDPVMFKDWKFQCTDAAAGKCTLYQGLENPAEPGSRYSAQFSPQPNVKGGIIAQISFPLGIYLPAGIGIKIGQWKQDFPMVVCLPQGCATMFVMPAEALREITDDKKMAVRFNINDRSPNEIYFPLNGLAAGIDKLKTIK